MNRKPEIYREIWDMEAKEGMRRYTTERILLMIEDGTLDKDTVIMACLKYMSEDEVADMAHMNEFLDEVDEDGTE